MNDAPVKKENVFFNRNFRLVFFGALVSDLGAVLYSFAVSFYILEISGNNAMVQGLYLGICGAVLLVSTPAGGVMGDRYSKAKIMFICDYLKGALILLATAGIRFFPDPAVQLVILFVSGISGNVISGIFSPSSGALLPHIVAEERLQQANAYFSAKSSMQSVAGVILAGILYAALPVYRLFFIVGICYLLSGFSEMFIRYDHTGKEGKLTVRAAVEDMRDGFLYLKKQKPILALLSAILFVNFFFHPVASNFIPFFIKTDVAGASSYLFDSFLTPELWSSIFMTLTGISMIIGSLILSASEQEEKCGRTAGLRLCMIAAALVALTIAYKVLVSARISLNAFLILFSAGCLAIGYLVACINIPINTAVMRTVDRSMLSKVTGMLSMISMGLTPVSSVLAGAILQYSGSTILLLICSMGFAAAAVSLLFSEDAKQI